MNLSLLYHKIHISTKTYLSLSTILLHTHAVMFTLYIVVQCGVQVVLRPILNCCKKCAAF